MQRLDSLALPAGTAAAAPLNIPPGVAPTNPVDGDTWTTSAGIFVRINGVTVGPLSAGGGGGSGLREQTLSSQADPNGVIVFYANYYANEAQTLSWKVLYPSGTTWQLQKSTAAAPTSFTTVNNTDEPSGSTGTIQLEAGATARFRMVNGAGSPGWLHLKRTA